MIRDEDLDTAVAQGVIDASQAARLRDLAKTRLIASVSDDLPADADDEKFRLIGGFNDVFVTIGVLLLVAALFALSGALGFGVAFAVVSLAAAWGLAEVFSRHMRLALPSIALAMMFAGSAAFLSSSLGAAVANLALSGGPAGAASGWHNSSTMIAIVFAGLGAALAAVAHERRFHVPIDSMLAASGLVAAVFGLAALAAPDWTSDNVAVLFALFGLGVFLVALRVDASDRQRRTRRSDVAFWLHLLAAPMIVHGGVRLVLGSSSGIDTAQAILILVLFALLGFVALIIDRRALLVSGLSYAGVAIAYLLSQGIEKGLGMSLTLLGLATVVLGLSAGWRSLRKAVLPLVPLGRLRQHIPPAEATYVA
jgi:hypothetical protein